MSAKVLPIRSGQSIWLEVSGVPYLKLHSVSRIYYVRKFKAGRGQLFKTTGKTTKRQAIRVADEMIAEWLQGRRPTTGRRARISDICDELERELEAQTKIADRDRARRQITWTKDQRMLKVMRALFGDMFADDINEDWWAQWVAFQGNPMGIRLFDHAKYLSKVLSFAYRRGYIRRKPAIHSPDPVQPKRPKVTMTDAEIAKIVRHAIKTGDMALELQAALGYENGFRPGEILGLMREMVTLDGKSAIVDLPHWFVKANARTVEVSSHAAKLLRAVLASHTSPYVFPSSHDPARPLSRKTQAKRWRQACKAAGVAPGRVVKSMRRAFYNKTLIEMGEPMAKVSQFGGTSVATLQKHYLNMDPSMTKSVGKLIQIRTGGKLVKRGRAHGQKSGK